MGWWDGEVRWWCEEEWDGGVWKCGVVGSRDGVEVWRGGVVGYRRVRLWGVKEWGGGAWTSGVVEW